MSSTRVSPVSFLKLSAEIASFYGFRSVRDIATELKIKTPRGAPTFVSATHVCASCVATHPARKSVLAFYATSSPTHVPPVFSCALPRGSQSELGEFGLYAAGTLDSTGEILLLKILSAIAAEWGTPIARVRINTVGDRDSRERYARELSAHLRRRAGDIDKECRDDMLRNPLYGPVCTHEHCRAVFAEGPRSVNYLSEKSRAHFKQVLEQIEELGFAYEIDDALLGDERGQQIVFSADLSDSDATILASFGGRYDDYLRRLALRAPARMDKETGAVSASIYFHKKGAGRDSFLLAPPARPPKIFFVQLGPLAKLKGLTVLDQLRRAHLPVLQMFDTDRLTPQLQAAQERGVSHLIIMGQREALDNTVIVRTLKNGTQETVALTALPRFLKTLKV